MKHQKVLHCCRYSTILSDKVDDKGYSIRSNYYFVEYLKTLFFCESNSNADFIFGFFFGIDVVDMQTTKKLKKNLSTEYCIAFLFPF